MKNTRVVILSDLWGKEKSNWVMYYIELLKDKLDVQYYDCCDLGGIDKTIYTEENLHSQFINGGIEKAVANLLKTEMNQIDVLAFSIGGTIAWKAALRGLDIRRLFAVSSTRLRYENEIPKSILKLYFAENDNYKPTNDWFEKHSIDIEIIKNKEHDFYTDIDCATLICEEILKKIDGNVLKKR